jgi:heme-degrading monooxygenase HmoA
MIVVFKHDVAPGEVDAFTRAWERCKLHAVGTVPGLQEAALLRSATRPNERLTLTVWDSIEAWEAYWNEGVPDPEGDVRKNERWIEVRAVRAKGAKS